MECRNPKYISKNDIVVPCGQCVFCGATRRSDWAFRLRNEKKLHDQAQFVTLTYANHELTFRAGKSQLVKKDLQDWFKRLRKFHKIRYYAVGEYGSKTGRPHYHVILFGSVPAESIRKTWTQGLVHIGQVNDQSIMYTLGYLTNKSTTTAFRKEKPFTLMSRRPGLGSNYLTPSMIAWHKSGRKNYVIQDGQRKHLPRFYKGKIFSKIDHIRIANTAQKQTFKAMVDWIRHPSRAVMRDPLAYREEQKDRLAKKIKSKTKEILTF